MHLWSKLASEICPKIGGLDRKTEQNRLKMSTLPSFFLTLYLLKNEKKLSIFYSKNKYT